MAEPIFVRQRVLRWEVPVDDQPHDIGGGAVLHVGARELHAVEVWTLESEMGPAGDMHVQGEKRTVEVFGTGQLLPNPLGRHLGSTLIGPLVWHLFEVAR